MREATDLREQETPRAVREFEPVPFEFLALFTLWSELSSCRPAPAIGMGGAIYLPLPASVIQDTLNRAGVADRSRDLIRYLLERLDRWWLEHMNRPRDDD